MCKRSYTEHFGVSKMKKEQEFFATNTDGFTTLSIIIVTHTLVNRIRLIVSHGYKRIGSSKV